MQTSNYKTHRLYEEVFKGDTMGLDMNDGVVVVTIDNCLARTYETKGCGDGKGFIIHSLVDTDGIVILRNIKCFLNAMKRVEEASIAYGACIGYIDLDDTPIVNMLIINQTDGSLKKKNEYGYCTKENVCVVSL